MTEWRPHPIFWHYEASKLGEIRYVGKRSLRALRTDRDGYLRFNLFFEGRRLTVKAHSFVAECWLGPIPSGLCVNHKDYVKTNNSIANLEYITASENTKRMFVETRHPSCKPVRVGARQYRSKRAAMRDLRCGFYNLPHFQLKD